MLSLSMILNIVLRRIKFFNFDFHGWLGTDRDKQIYFVTSPFY